MSTIPKGNPVPVRLDPMDSIDVDNLSENTGIPKAEIIRRCLRFALPKFIGGKADLLKYGAKKPTSKKA